MRVEHTRKEKQQSALGANKTERNGTGQDKVGPYVIA